MDDSRARHGNTPRRVEDSEMCYAGDERDEMTKLIWDIQEEHVDEAEFLLEMHASCMDSPKFTLAQVQAGPERRLLARIDALLVGGQSVIERLLLPILAAPDEDEF